MKKFICAKCKKEFQAAWSDEEAKTEFRKNFPDYQKEATEQVCDDCYKKMFPQFPRQPPIDNPFPKGVLVIPLTDEGDIEHMHDTFKKIFGE